MYEGIVSGFTDAVNKIESNKVFIDSDSPRLLRPLLGALLAAALIGCATLPDRAPLPTTHAARASADTSLGALAIAASVDADLTGFRLLPSGSFALDARLELIRRAERTLDLQYYQIEDDETGRVVLAALADAGRRGVHVRLLVDDLYTSGEDELFLGLAAMPNVEVRLFNPFAGGRSGLGARFAASLFDFARVNRRMHNKLFIADGAIAVAGGRNIGNDYFARSAAARFLDVDTLVVGALLPRLGELFDRYWNSEHVRPAADVMTSALASDALRRRFAELIGAEATPAPPAPPPNDVLGYAPLSEELAAGRLSLIWAPAEAYADSPDRVVGQRAQYGGVPLQDVDSVRYNVVEAMRRARTSISLVTPYLVPGAGGLEVIREARARGVAVTLVTNSFASTDEPLVYTAYRRYRPDLLRAGAEVWELSAERSRASIRLGLLGAKTGRLHAKLAIIDAERLFIGSLNFDPRSAETNTEIGLFVTSRELARQLAQLVDGVKRQGAWRLRLAADGAVEWYSADDAEGGVEVMQRDPGAAWSDRWLVELLAPLVPEALL